MSAPYSAEAIDYCFKLYVRFYGKRPDLIEREMNRAGWPHWRSKNLYNHKSGRGKEKIGWIERYGFDERLKQYLAGVIAPSLDSAQELVREIDEIRRGLATEIKAKGADKTDKERLQLHRDYCNLSISALTKVEAARDTLSGWVSFFERLIDWAVDVDPKLARKLTDKADEFIERAEKEFGEEQPQMNADDADSKSMNANANPENPATDDRTED